MPDLVLVYDPANFRPDSRYDVYIADFSNETLFYKSGMELPAALEQFDRLYPKLAQASFLTYGRAPEFRSVSGHSFEFIDEIMHLDGDNPCDAYENEIGESLKPPLLHPVLKKSDSFRPYELCVFAQATIALYASRAQEPEL